MATSTSRSRSRCRLALIPLPSTRFHTLANGPVSVTNTCTRVPCGTTETVWWKVSRAPRSLETSTNSLSVSFSITNFVAGPPLGLSTPVEPVANGPSRRTHSVSVFHSGQVAMSAQRAKNADGLAGEVTSAFPISIMKLVCALTKSSSSRVLDMQLTVLGSDGAWPAAGRACSGFLLEHEGYRLLLDAGYAVVPALQRKLDVTRLDAVYITHGHPDHCADLNPLLRARALRDDPAPPLDVYAPRGALKAVLALDRPGMLDRSIRLHEFEPGEAFELGPMRASTCQTPHWSTNAAIRLSTKDDVLVYTGDGGPSPDVVDLARDAGLLIAEASYVDEVPADSRGQLSSARDAGRLAKAAGVNRLMLTHLVHGQDAAAAAEAAAAEFDGEVINA